MASPFAPTAGQGDTPDAALSDFKQDKMSIAVDQLRRRTRYGRRLSRLCRLPYFLRPFPPQLQAEWEALKAFKTAKVARKREKLARTEKQETLARKGKWREKDDSKPGAAQHVLEYLRSFFGYLALPVVASPEVLAQIDKLGFTDDPQKPETEQRQWAVKCVQGLGIAPSNFSLAYLADADLVLSHLDFMQDRTGVYSGGTMWTLRFVMSLLQEGTGYLRQQPAFGRLMLNPITDPLEWEAHCAHCLRILSQAARDLVEDDQVEMSREPAEPIADILALQAPVNALFDLTAKIRADVPARASPRRLAIHFRNVLFTSMLPFTPLRIKLFSDMRLEENLYKTADGTWRLFFPAAAFKNERGASKKDYDVPIDESLWPVIEEYITLHRPHLAGGDDPKGYVFLKSRQPKNNDAPTAYRIGQAAFRQILHRLTGTYLKIIFGPMRCGILSPPPS